MLKGIPVYDLKRFTYQGKEGDFFADRFSELLQEHGQVITTPHRHSFYFSIMFTRGSGQHEIDFHVYEVTPGSVFMMSPGQVHSWRISKDVEGYVIIHKREFYDLNFAHEKVNDLPFFNCIQNIPFIKLDEQQTVQLGSLYREIIEEYQSQRLMKFQKIGSLLNVLYINLSRLYLPDLQLTAHQEIQLAQVRKFEQLVEKHFPEHKEPGKYAEMMFMTERNLNRICKNVLNRSVSELIAERINLEAKRMLIYTEYSITEISAELGYLDNSYFARVFKKRTGKTPLEFQKAYRRRASIKLA
jgi:AraC family transcriptional activator of pobA